MGCKDFRTFLCETLSGLTEPLNQGLITEGCQFNLYPYPFAQN